MKQREWQELKERFHSLRPGGWPTFAMLSFDGVVLIASAFLWAQDGILASLASWALLALALSHAFLFLHEAAHSAVSKSRLANDGVGHLCGWLIGMPFASRRREHLNHHLWAGHPTGDLTNRRVIERFSEMTDEQAQALERVWKSWLPLLTLNHRVGMWKLDILPLRLRLGSRRFDEEIRSMRFYALGYTAMLILLLAFGKAGTFFAWYLPGVFAQLFLEELASLPHHAETPLLREEDKALPYWEQDRVTHSCKSVPIWSRFVLLNFNHHVAHHLLPSVPWYGLPAVSREIRETTPGLVRETQTQSEIQWSLQNRRRPLLEIMGHYFDRIPGPSFESAGQPRVERENPVLLDDQLPELPVQGIEQEVELSRNHR
jgi:omega-6 fatty acid desaturase (delta-12 desaturase)